MRRKANTDEAFSGMAHGEVGFDWDSLAKRILKAELARAGLTYKALAKRLEAMGIEDNETAIANRISRGKFPFAFLLQCMSAIGVAELDLRDRTYR
jgi:hypothetical protein